MVLLLVCLVCAAQQGRKNPFESNPEQIDIGRATFRIFCSPCHGIRGQGGRGPDLTLGAYSAGESDEDLYKLIEEGVPGTEMPGFGERMNEDTLWQVAAYLRSIARRDTSPIPGDSAAGEQMFWGKGQCGACHRIGARGGRLGPELSRVGRSRSVAYLRESIVSPNADLTPGYNTLTVMTKEGNKIEGVEKNIDNFSAQLMDAEENIHSFWKGDVKSIQREFRSLMPEGYGNVFTREAMNDLVAYLAGLRGGE